MEKIARLCDVCGDDAVERFRSESRDLALDLCKTHVELVEENQTESDFSAVNVPTPRKAKAKRVRGSTSAKEAKRVRDRNYRLRKAGKEPLPGNMPNLREPRDGIWLCSCGFDGHTPQGLAAHVRAKGRGHSKAPRLDLLNGSVEQRPFHEAADAQGTQAPASATTSAPEADTIRLASGEEVTVEEAIRRAGAR